MYALRYTGLWLSGGIVLLAIIIYMSLATGGPVMSITLNDKVTHTLAYTVLMLWFGGIYQRRSHWQLVLAFIALGAGLEFLQSMGGVREYSVTDMILNGFGVILGKLLCSAGLSGWCQKIEQLLLPR